MPQNFDLKQSLNRKENPVGLKAACFSLYCIKIHARRQLVSPIKTKWFLWNIIYVAWLLGSNQDG